MATDNGNGNLSFAERVAKAKAEAAAKAGHPANAAASTKSTQVKPEIPVIAQDSKKQFYFQSSIDTFRIIGPGGNKYTFVRHFLITEDEGLAEYIRKNYASKVGGSVRIMEVSEMTYQSSTMIQPEILPLPEDMQNLRDKEAAEQQQQPES